MARGERKHRPAGLGRIERKRDRFYVYGPGIRGARGERIGEVFQTRPQAEAALSRWLREHARELGPEVAVLSCGCGPEGGCSLGALLFRFERFIALDRHLAESYEQTFLGAGARKMRVTSKAEARP